MADTARELRQLVSSRLGEEGGAGQFTALMQDVRSQLVADLDEERFSDMCAQTLVYGVLSSRVTDPDGFGASPSLATVPLANPFLSAFFEQVYDHVVDVDPVASGFETLVDDLRATNVEAILDQFGSTVKGGDPVIHFYEEFLTRYDRRLRADSGAFYTPQPIVAFMTRCVDELLKSRFHLPLGVADGTPWSTVAERVGFSMPETVDTDRPFLSMIDPATGTGTFLVEWLRRGRTSFLAENPNGDWATHVRDQLLDNVNAFELMLGPYAIAHLKVALELHDEGLAEASAGIYLTDTLDHTPAQPALETMQDPVAVEGELAARLKDGRRFTVIIGNPPYDREQRDPTDFKDGRRKGGIVRYGVPGIRPLLADVTEPMRAAGLGKHLKNVYNDYVYFWRWATWQATERPEGPGIVAFITASSYLEGVSMGGLRNHLRERFDDLWLIDLGGEGRGAHTEENVFDIRTPVAIAFGVRTGVKGSDHGCRVHYQRIRGTRQEKFDALRTLVLSSDAFTDIGGSGLERFTPRSTADYHSWPEITDLFPWIHSGCQVKRTWPIGPSQTVLERRWEALISTRGAKKADALRTTGARTIHERLSPLLGQGQTLPPIASLRSGDRPEGLIRYGYRSFDRQWILADRRVIDAPKEPFWRSRSNHQLFLTTLTSTKLGAGPVITVTPYVPDLDHFRGSYGAKNVMPLYRDRRGREPNVTEGLCEAMTLSLGTNVDPRSLAAYVYGLAGTPAFSERFSQELGEGAGPVRIPLTADPVLFAETVLIGRELLWLHTWGERFRPDSGPDFPVGVATVVRQPTSYPNDFRYDAAGGRLLVGDGVIEPVSKDVWAFQVSGLQVLRSWLGYRMEDRKGRKSSPLDDIRPARWTFTEELLMLLALLERTIELTPNAADLLDRILAGALIDPSELPTPPDFQRQPPRSP
jgi:predicted helicase